MKFRLKAFGLHLLASAAALTLIFGSLYLGWYRWPGWHLADVSRVVFVMAGVDVVVGHDVKATTRPKTAGLLEG